MDAREMGTVKFDQFVQAAGGLNKFVADVKAIALLKLAGKRGDSLEKRATRQVVNDIMKNTSGREQLWALAMYRRLIREFGITLEMSACGVFRHSYAGVLDWAREEGLAPAPFVRMPVPAPVVAPMVTQLPLISPEMMVAPVEKVAPAIERQVSPKFQRQQDAQYQRAICLVHPGGFQEVLGPATSETGKIAYQQTHGQKNLKVKTVDVSSIRLSWAKDGVQGEKSFEATADNWSFVQGKLAAALAAGFKAAIYVA